MEVYLYSTAAKYIFISETNFSNKINYNSPFECCFVIEIEFSEILDYKTVCYFFTFFVASVFFL